MPRTSSQEYVFSDAGNRVNSNFTQQTKNSTMHRKLFIQTVVATTLATAGLFGSAATFAAAQHDGSAAKPLRVILIPADGGTEDGTKKDFEPIFGAINQSTGLKFDIKVGQSYGAVVEAMCNGAADIAWFGPASYLQARSRGCAELLALAVRQGASVY